MLYNNFFNIKVHTSFLSDYPVIPEHHHEMFQGHFLSNLSVDSAIKRVAPTPVCAGRKPLKHLPVARVQQLLSIPFDSGPGGPGKGRLSVHNCSVGPVARIFLGWDPTIFGSSILFSSDQLIVSEFLPLDGSTSFVLSVVYGHNKAIDRRQLWDDRRITANSVGTKPWVQMGDFNTVRATLERLVGFDSNVATEFNHCLADILHDDLPAKGFWFTWTNKRGGLGDNKSRIHRVISNNQWLVTFLAYEAFFLAPGLSDHCPMNSVFKKVLVQSWTKHVTGRPMFVLSTKLKRLKGALKNFNFQYYSNISKGVCDAKEELDRVQDLYFQSPFDSALCHSEKDMLGKYVELRMAEESFLKQKTRIKWLALGDQNSRYFHRKMCSHRARNTILSLTNSVGTLIDDPEAVMQEILGYYIGLLGTPFMGKTDSVHVLTQAIHTKVPHHLRAMLVALITVTEIKAALMSINGDKAPGPDGFNSLFFQKSWDVVGSDFVAAVASFFESGMLLKEWNATTISLIPKEKILHRILSWDSKTLSYDGRALLIQSILFSIQVYWSSIFIIPSKVIKEIECTLLAFLWSGTELKHSGAKVKWDQICCLKEEGGLGFRRIKKWNRASMLRHLWALCKKADTLWVKWMHTYFIKENCLWTMDIPCDSFLRGL
ncbi:uncharacterized protein LOC131323927 [Rhododendron vialii]|uniref:uncharacterized protein LOC131323927 n=1 Tax=Rhododendron vialii TaxID=182163 RepID=UPI00265F4299|nr:uncharacterized protein LOC131323927 [Rhododendron vialii]